MTIRQIVDLWNQFWFTPHSVLPITLLRICFGTIMLLWCALLYPEVTTFYGAHPIVPTATASEWYGDSALNIFDVLPRTDNAAYGVLLATAVAAFYLTIGFLTRLSAAILLICIVSFAHACPLIMHSGDTFSRVLAFLFIFAPSNKMLAVDAFIRRLLQRGESPPVNEDADVVWPVWVTRLFQLEVCAVYFQSFWGKVHGETWLDGTAVYYTSRLLEFKRFSLPVLFDHLGTIQAITWGTLAIEFSMFTLIWIKELRYWVLLAAVCMHLVIDWTMNIPLFEWIMMASFLSFVDGIDIHRAINFIRRRIMRSLPEPVADASP